MIRSAQKQTPFFTPADASKDPSSFTRFSPGHLHNLISLASSSSSSSSRSNRPPSPPPNQGRPALRLFSLFLPLPLFLLPAFRRRGRGRRGPRARKMERGDGKKFRCSSARVLRIFLAVSIKVWVASFFYLALEIELRSKDATGKRTGEKEANFCLTEKRICRGIM